MNVKNLIKNLKLKEIDGKQEVYLSSGGGEYSKVYTDVIIGVRDDKVILVGLSEREYDFDWMKNHPRIMDVEK